MKKQYRPLAAALAVALPLGLAALAPVQAQQPANGSTASASANSTSAGTAPAAQGGDAAAQMQTLNADTSTPALARGDRGDAVVRAQTMLTRHWFSPGEIDGIYGSNMIAAVSAFQRARGLEASGKLDAATWQALGQQAPVFATYQLTEQDMQGPYHQIPEDPKQQAELPSLSYEDAVEAISERFFMSPKLLESLNKGRELRAGQMILVTDVGRAAEPPSAKTVRIDKSNKMLYLVGEDDKVVGAMPVSIGSSQDPLPVGMLKITSEVRLPDFRYDPSLLRTVKLDEKVTVPPGPNSPVGIYWLGLTKEHWGIHGTSEPSQMRKVETNGCIRLTNWDVARLAKVIEIGTMVEVQG